MLSSGRLTTEQCHLTAQLPQTGSDFSITDVIGRCGGNTPNNNTNNIKNTRIETYQEWNYTMR